MRAIAALAILAVLTGSACAQEVPGAYAGIERTSEGSFVFVTEAGERLPLRAERPAYTPRMVRGDPVGSETGLVFDFADPEHDLVLPGGTLYFGFIKHGDGEVNLPVFYKRSSPIKAGRAEIDIKKRLVGKYDMVGWAESGRGTLGYRVVDAAGRMLYDGKIAFVGKGPFTVDVSIVMGPFLAKPLPDGVTVAFETNVPSIGRVEIDGRVVMDDAPRTRHEIDVRGLEPATTYSYRVATEKGRHAETRTFTTPPLPGSRRPFVFAYASDSRAGEGGGERSLGGTNAYMVKRLAAVARSRGVAFLQFTGDLIGGYCNHPGPQRVQYMNWKRAIEPWAGSFPAIAGMGNHEALTRIFEDGSRYGLSIDRFPFETESAEAVFAEQFVNFENGPESEDGAVYDPDPDTIDFPSYRENVFTYVYDNVAMVVLNSDYFYSPSGPTRKGPPGGNIHGYLMDNQIAWLTRTLDSYEANEDIDIVFVTQHTPTFPNGGHLGDDMWYSGRNGPRASVRGEPVEEGIIERRDRYWRILMEHEKVWGILTGDEHNYNRMLLKEGVDIYGPGPIPDLPEGYERLELTRPVWQVNNGAAGAPYYAQEETPWTEHVMSFTTRNALVLFHIDGKKVTLEVVNPETLEKIE